MDRQLIHLWIDQLDDENRQTRSEAIRHLLDTGLPAIPPLVGAFCQEETGLRIDILQILKQIDNQQSVKAFTWILREADLDARCKAIQALDFFGFSPVIRQALCDALSDPDPRVRHAILQKLSQNQRAIEAVVQTAQTDPDPAIRREAIYTLAHLADPRAADYLLQDLKSNDPEIRYKALDGLIRLHDERVIGPLIAEMRSPDPRDRHRAAGLARWLPNPRTVPALIDLLADSAAVVLWNNGDEHEDTVVWVAAFRALHSIGVPALCYLQDALNHEQPRTREIAARLIAIIKRTS